MEHKFSFKKLLSLLLVCSMLLSSFTFLAFADEPTNVALGSKYEIVGLTPSGSYPDTDNKELTDGTRVDGIYNDSGWVGVILTSTVRSFDVVVTLGDGETVYNIDKIVVNAGAAGCTCGVTEPDLKAFYSVDGNEWLEFGSYTPTGTDATNVNATMAVDTPVAAKYIKVNVGRAVGIGNLMWLGEIEAYGEEAPEAPKDKVSIVISGETNVIGGVDAAIEKLTDGNWALNAEAWGGNTDGVVLIQNTAATDASKREAIHLIYEFGETPEAYNTIKLGLYSSVESMIGFPTEEDVYFSNDGETWVSGYDDIGYGETIPDAYTTFDGDPTKPGTVIAEVRIESPVTYKYVKFVLRYPESPFTEENGYTDGTAKPRWEFFGLTEIAFDNVEVSSVITDFNASEYWESRYGRGSGSFGYTDADAYAVAWDNFIDNRFTQLAFAPVANAENVYEIVAKENGANALDFPEGGFIWLAFTNANADSAAKAAIDLFGTMSVGETYKFTGFDFENGFVVKDATIKSWSPLPELYWPVGEYDVSETDGNITPHHAWGYEFTLDTVNSITGNTTALFTTEAAYVAGNVGKWSTKIVLAPTDKAGVYTVDTVHKTTGKKGDADVSEGIISFDGGKLVMVVQDAGTRPEKDENGNLKFPNWEERAAAWGLMSTVGAKVTLAGIDVAAGTHENGTVTVQDAPKNVLLGVSFDKLTGTYYSYGDAMSTDGSELTDGYYITEDNYVAPIYKVEQVAGFGGLKDSTLELEGALDATYSINKIVVHYANGLAGSGICEPGTIKAFYKNGDGEWTQFGETFVSTETDENQGNNSFLISTVTFTGAPVEATNIRFELTPRSGKTMVFISELEAWGEKVEVEPEEPDGIVIDGALTDWEDNWTVVNGETGYWQAIPDDEAELAGYYNFQITSDENNLYIAAEIVDLTCTAFRVWFRTNPEATVYTHFYHIDANGAAGKVNTSTTANSATAITDSKAVGVFKVGEDSIIVEISIPLSEIGATDGNVEYYANTQSGSTLFYPPVAEGENGDRLANLPYKNWYVAPSEPEEPELPDVVEIKVSHVNAYNWGTFEAMIITGDGKTVEEVIGQKPQWWIVYTVENVDGKYVATNYLKNSEECYKVTVPTGGFLFYVFDANSAYAAADEEKLLGYTFVVDGLKLDGVTAIDTTLNDPKLIYAYAPGVEIPEPEPAPVTSQVVNGFNIKHYNDGSEGSSGAFIFTDAEVYAGGGTYSWWRQVAFAPSADVEGYYEVVAITNGEGGESGGHEIAEGGFIWIAFEWPELAGSSGVYALGIMNTLAVGDLVKFNGVDIANCTTTEDASAEKYVAPVDPNAPVNVALNKEYVISGCGTPYAQYQALLTDGKMINTVSYDANWFTFYCNGNDSSIINAPDHIGYVIIDLGALYDVNTVKAHIIAPGVSGIKGPKSVKAYFSADNENWSEAYVLDMSAFADPAAAFYAVAEAEAQAQYVKVEFELDGVFAFVNEIEVYGEEAATEPAYKEGLTIEIDDTLVGWIGGAEDLETIENGLTDGNWGAGDAGNWNNVDGVYPFMNKVCKDGSVHPEVNLIYNFGEATDVNTIKLGVYSSYNVMIGYPSSLIYVYTSEDGANWSEGIEAYLDLDIPAIGNEGSVSTTLTLAETINAQYVKVVLSFPDSPFEDKVVWEFIGLTEIAFDYVPVEPELPEDAIILDYAGYVHDSFFEIVAGDNMTVADLTALGIGASKDMNYFYVVVVDANNVITETYFALGRPDGVKSEVVCPEGGYILALNANKEGADALLAAEVGGSVVLYNIDVESFRGAEGSIALENAGFVLVPAPAASVEIELVEGDNDITVPAGGSAIANTNFDKELVITIKGQWGITVLVNGVEYYPNRMGVLEAKLPAGENVVEFKNGGEEEATFVANVAAPTVGDTPDDPIIIDELGDFTAEINDKYPQGVYYTYTATEDGTLVITIKTESGWTYTVNNLTAGKYGDIRCADDEELVISEILEVKAGDEIQIVVNTYDPENPWALTVGSVEFSVAYDNGEDTVEIALGDVNMDGKIDQYDYVLVKRAYFDTYTLSEAQAAVADATGDGKVDPYDYLLIARHYFETFEIKGTVEVPADAVPQK